MMDSLPSNCNFCLLDRCQQASSNPFNLVNPGSRWRIERAFSLRILQTYFGDVHSMGEPQDEIAIRAFIPSKGAKGSLLKGWKWQHEVSEWCKQLNHIQTVCRTNGYNANLAAECLLKCILYYCHYTNLYDSIWAIYNIYSIVSNNTE